MTLAPGTLSHLQRAWEHLRTNGASRCGENTASGIPGHRTAQDGGQVCTRSKISFLSWAAETKTNRYSQQNNFFQKKIWQETLWFSNSTPSTPSSTGTSVQKSEGVNTRLLIAASLVMLTSGDTQASVEGAALKTVLYSWRRRFRAKCTVWKTLL